MKYLKKIKKKNLCHWNGIQVTYHQLAKRNIGKSNKKKNRKAVWMDTLSDK